MIGVSFLNELAIGILFGIAGYKLGTKKEDLKHKYFTNKKQQQKG